MEAEARREAEGEEGETMTRNIALENEKYDDALCIAAVEYAKVVTKTTDSDRISDVEVDLYAAALAYARPIVAEECARIVEDGAEDIKWLVAAIREHGKGGK